MGYTYAQRKRPRGQNTAPERTGAPGPDLTIRMPGQVWYDPARTGRSPDLDAAMRARMTHSFGDLSALKGYEPPARETAPLPAAPYTGPVTRTLSNASPSPAAAGPMQAKRKTGEETWQEKAANPQTAMEAAMALPDEDPNQPALRPWEISEEQLQNDHFNPTRSKDLALMQANIDVASSPEQAYSMFSNMVGNANGGMKTKEGGRWNPTEVDPDAFKAKLKNMLRMYHDYPELEGQIGNMVQNTDLGTSMATSGTYGKRTRANLDYNASSDKKGGFFTSILRFFGKKLDKAVGFSAADKEYDGNHELGHVLNSLILAPGGTSLTRRMTGATTRRPTRLWCLVSIWSVSTTTGLIIRR